MRRVPSLAELTIGYAASAVTRVARAVGGLVTGGFSPEDEPPARFRPDHCRVSVDGPWLRRSGWAPVDAGERRRDCFLFRDDRGAVRVGRSTGWIGPEVSFADRAVRGPWTVLSCRLEGVQETVLLVALGDEDIRWAKRARVQLPRR